MTSTVILLSLIFTTISCFNIESHLDIWCGEPIETVDLNSINLRTNVDSIKNLIHRCAIWLRHIPKKNWTSELTEIFRDVFKPKLSVLKISDGLEELQENFFTLESKLRYLDLSGNNLNHLVLPEFKYELPDVYHNLFHHVYTLDLSKNNFENISFVKTKIPNLKELDLSYNKLTEVPLGTLYNFLDLEKLILRYNNIIKFENSTEFSSVEYLDLSNNHLENFLGAEKFANLHTLIVSHNHLKILNTNTFKDDIWGLKDLYMDHNEITEVSDLSFKNFPNLKTLKLNNNLISNIKLGTFLVLKNLESLDISNNFISNLDTGLFSNQNNLIEVNLRNNSLKSLDYVEIVHLSKSLKEIDILENQFECDYFQKMLQYLTEKNNIVVPGGEICLGASFEQTCCLKEFTKSTSSFLTESLTMKRLSHEVKPSYLKNYHTSYNISQFLSSIEKKCDALLKLSVYQFAFIISVSGLALVLYLRRNYKSQNFDPEKKQPELEKIISNL